MNEWERKDLKDFLDEKVEKYNRSVFIETDPIQVPKNFAEPENIEISAFLTASVSWGTRPSIIKNANRLMSMLHYQPYDFILHASIQETKKLETFVHRTFNGNDTIFFIRSLKNIYQKHGGLEKVFTTGYHSGNSVKSAFEYFYRVFFETGGERTRKHVSNVRKGASAKRLNMFLRWMVRQDNKGVDFGIWREIPPSALMLPLDVHTGNVARKLSLLKRKSNDWQAVEEVTEVLRTFDAEDPVKYDFALFGLGIFEKF